MSDPEMLPSKNFIESLEKITEGGLLRLFASKPVQEAIGRLVYGAFDVPVAKLEQFTQAIRNETEARKQVASTILAKVLAQIPEDSALIDRAKERWTTQFAKQQKCRENVAIRTLALFASNDIPPDCATPSEEFMGVFEQIAERASSDELADLMARILTGEIRKPKSVSRRTLQVAAILDKEIVDALSRVAPYVLDPGWIYVPPKRLATWREDFRLLSGVSICSTVSIRAITFDSNNKCFIQVGSKCIVLTQYPQKLPWAIDGADLTPAGTDFVRLLPIRNERRLFEIAEWFKELPKVENVEICDIIEDKDGNSSLGDAVEEI